MIKKTIGFIDLEKIANSGQCFRWKSLDKNTYLIPSGKRTLEITKDSALPSISGGEFSLDCSEAEWDSYWSGYLDMDTDYEQIEKLIMDSRNSYMIEALRAGSGIRILRQDFWEILVSFIISQNNNIKRIKGSIEAICERAGLHNGKGFDFPYPWDINAESFDFTGLGLGYRDGYLREIFKYGRDNPRFWEDFAGKGYEENRGKLLLLKGVGPKVADCVSLFGLHHVEAFPIDTHIKQILAAHFPEGFPYEYYEGVAGIVQQYMFYYKQYLKEESKA